MAEFDITRLSDEMYQDYLEYKRTGEDGMYLLVSPDKNHTTDQILMRIQSSNAEHASFSGLKTKAEWKASTFGPNQVRPSQKPLSKTGKYSSFALMENETQLKSCAIRFPLRHSFAAVQPAFKEKEFANYLILKNRIERRFGVQLIDSSKYAKTSMVERGSFMATIKKAIFVKKGVSEKQVYAAQKIEYGGKIYLNEVITLSNGLTYTISEQEKITKAIDYILQVAIDQYDRNNKDFELDAEEKFAARLVADVLMSRAINYGDAQDNINAEMALTLQLANVLARIDLEPQRLKLVANVGLQTAVDLMAKLDITIEDVKAGMISAKHTYKNQPQNLIEAVAPVNAVEQSAADALTERLLGQKSNVFERINAFKKSPLAQPAQQTAEVQVVVEQKPLSEQEEYENAKKMVEEFERKEAERKAEEERLAREKAEAEQRAKEEAERKAREEEERKAEEARRAEEARLKAEQEARERAERERQEEYERALKIVEARQREEEEAKKAAEAKKAEEERLAREKAEAEQRAKEEAERKAREEEERKAEEARRAEEARLKAEQEARERAERERQEEYERALKIVEARQREEQEAKKAAEAKKAEEERLAREKAEAEQRAKEEAEKLAKEEQQKQELTQRFVGAIKKVRDDKEEEEFYKQVEAEEKAKKDAEKLSQKGVFIGVKDKVYIKRSKAYEYIDELFAKVVSKETDLIVSKRYSDAAKNIQYLDRQYNFLDHVVSFYNKNKNKDNSAQIQRELSCEHNVGDNNVAHAFANAFIELRNMIVESIFDGQDKIEKIDGKTISNIINEYVESKFGKSLNAFVAYKIKNETKEIFKRIDMNCYEQTCFVDEMIN